MSLGLRSKAIAKEWLLLKDPYPYKRYMRRTRCVFVHIPKNGGTSFLRAVAKDAVRQHVSWFVFWQANRFLYEHYFKFAIVRDPYDRAVSLYEYLRSGGSRVSDRDRELSEDIRVRAPAFGDFVMDYLEPARLCTNILLRPQAYFVCDGMLKVRVDHLCRLERLEEDMRVVWERIGRRPPAMPRENQSDRRPVAEYYTPEIAARIHELYEPDFRIFDYSTATPGARTPD